MLLGYLLAPALLATLATALAIENLVLEPRQAPIYGSTTVRTNCKSSGTFALTFDDGPYQYGRSIATTLNNNKVKGSLFLNGANWGCIYDRADDIIAAHKAGHLIGSHTWGHLDVTKLTATELNRQLILARPGSFLPFAFAEHFSQVETALMKIIGVKPRFFRPPYGSINAAALTVLKARGYYTATWNFDSGDSMGSSPAQSVAAYSQLYSRYPSPIMALNHETYAGTANQVMPVVVPKLIAAGYKLVTVAQCLGLEPYQVVGTRSARDSTWTCSGLPALGVP